MNRPALLLVAVAACILPGVVADGLVAGRGPVPRTSAPTELRLSPYIANLRTIGVSVGKATVPFLFDTGGGFTILTPEVAQSAGCVPFGRVTGFRSTGERLDLPRCGPVSMRFGALTVRTEGAVMDLMSLLKGAPPVGGLVSLHTLEKTPFTLDLAANRILIETPRSLAQRVIRMRPATVRLSRQAGGTALDLFLEVRTPNGPIWLELDSGNAGPVLLSPHAAKQLGVTLSTEEPRRLIVDVHGLSPTPVDAVEKDLIYDGLLNAAFLETIVLTVDLGSSRAWVARNASRAAH